MRVMIEPIIFDQWNEVKKSLEVEDRVAYFKQGQLWWCNIGQNLGAEVYGKGIRFTRPVLIFRKLSSRQFLGFPLTGKDHEVGNWYCTFRHAGQVMTAMLYQARVLDKKRLIKRIGQVDDEDFMKITQAFKTLYCP